MKNNNILKLISIFCLGIYILFGCINISDFGICFGEKNNKHIGLIVGGYSSCCHETHFHNDNRFSYSDKCNDFYFNSISVVQDINSFGNLLKNLDSSAYQLLTNYFYNYYNYGIKQLVVSNNLRASPNDWFKSKVVHKSINLII